MKLVKSIAVLILLAASTGAAEPAPPKPGMAKFSEGLRLQGAKRYADAAEAYKEAISKPKDLDERTLAWAHRELGSVTMELKDLTGAEQAFKKSVELDPKNSGAQLGLAQVYTLQGRLDHAEAALRLSLTLAAKQANALYDRLAEQARSDPKLAALRKRPSFEKLFDVRRTHSLVKDQLVKADRLRTGGQHAQAVPAYEKIISAPAGLSDAELGSAYHGLGKSAIAAGDAEKAAPALVKALEIAGRPDADIHFDLACAFAMRGDLKIAQNQLSECFKAEDGKHGHAMLYLSKTRTEPRLAVIRKQPGYDEFIAWWSLPKSTRREAEKLGVHK